VTSLSAKIIASILIGVIIAGGAGYYYYTEYIVPQIEELQDAVDQLTSDYEGLTGEFNALTDEHEELNQQLQGLQDEHTELLGDQEELMSEYEALTEQYEQLQSEYETLLSDYEAAFGGLDISPESIPVLEKLYTWEWDEVERSVTITVPEQLYDYYSEKDRYQTTDYRGYVLHPLDDQYVEALVYEFNLIQVNEGLTEENKTDLVVSFIQNMEYVLDADSKGLTEYPRFPVETLVDGGGDCEDTGILMASLLDAMGYNISLILLPDHLAVGIEVNATGTHWVYDNVTYYYLETTAPGWEEGEVPPEHDPDEATLYPVEEMPFLAYSWTATRVNNKATVNVHVNSEGAVPAEDYRIWLAVEDEDGFILAETHSSYFDLAYGEDVSYKLKVTGPRFMKQRLVVGVKNPEGETSFLSYSEYYTTR
jgi:archaellum component FlaC